MHSAIAVLFNSYLTVDFGQIQFDSDKKTATELLADNI